MTSPLHKTIPALPPKRQAVFKRLVAVAGSNECWEWQGYRLENGYGQFKLHCKSYKAHRVAYFIATGIQPGEKLVCHSCDNRGCCNPSHLFLGTNADNSADMARKNRAARQRGEKHGHSKLTDSDIMAIRVSDATPTTLANRLGVCPSLISQIRQRKIWKHLS